MNSSSAAPTGKRALVVGGAGFIGSQLTVELRSRGFHVSVLDKRSGPESIISMEGIDFLEGDVLDRFQIEGCVRDIDIVYSVFGILGGWGIPAQQYWDINTKGVINLMECCSRSNVEQFIHISSAGVLGPLPDGIVADESFVMNPSNVYEESKSRAEKEILRFGKEKGLPYTIIRPEFVYGPGDLHVLGLFKAIHDRIFVYFGGGKSLLHPTYIEDVINGILLCTGNRKAIGETFLITGCQPVSVKALAGAIADAQDVAAPKISVPLAAARMLAIVMESISRIGRFEPKLTRDRVRFFSQNRAFDHSKAQSVLGYNPKIDIKEGTLRTVNWYRSQGFL